MRKIKVAALVLPVVLAGCGGQNFSEVAGNIRVQGTVSQSILSPDHQQLSLHVPNAQTGAPLSPLAVEVKPQSGSPVRASKVAGGDYTADFPASDHVDVLIETAIGTSVITLQRQ